MTIESFFLEDNTKQLFCAFHPKQQNVVRSRSILLCSPLGPEYFRSYRIIRQLADQLAAKGHNVLRFDWSSHGDSSGRSIDGSVEAWENDIRITSSELIKLADVKKITIIATRFSAALLTNIVQSIPFIENIILWDPVLDGYKWLRLLMSFHFELFPFIDIRNNTDYTELLGYPFSNSLFDKLLSFENTNFNNPVTLEMHTIISDKNLLPDTFNKIFLKNHTQIIPNCDFFPKSAYFDRVIMSNPAIPMITKLLSDESI